MSESLTEPQTTVYECSNLLHDFGKQKTGGARPICNPISLRFGTRQINIEAGGKSSGMDGISNQYMTDSLTYIFNVYIAIFSSIWDKNMSRWFHFQNLWIKQIRLIIRPVSLLSGLSKLSEKQVHSHLHDCLEKRHFLHPFQSGFRRNYSCNTALARLTNSWLTAMNQSEVSGVIFLTSLTSLITISNWRSSPLILETQLRYHLKKKNSCLDNRMQCTLLHGSYSSEDPIKFDWWSLI